MIYLRRIRDLAIDIAIVEEPEKAARYEAQGYEQCSRARLSVYWSLRDEATLTELRRAVPVAETAPLARAVGHTV